LEDRVGASVPVRRAVTWPEPSFEAAVRADSEAGRKVWFLCSRMARVERLERERRGNCAGEVSEGD